MIPGVGDADVVDVHCTAVVLGVGVDDIVGVPYCSGTW
jgi:hypothetical protein